MAQIKQCRFRISKDTLHKIIIAFPALMISIYLLLSIFSSNITPSFISVKQILTINLLFWALYILKSYFTYYVINDNHLVIKFALIYTKKINFDQIASIQPQKGGLWIMGLSQDAIAIRKKNGQAFIISPERPNEFIKLIEKKI